MKRKSLRAVPPDEQYGTRHGSGGDIMVTLIEIGEAIMFLLDNYATWVDQGVGARNVVEYIHCKFCYEKYFQHRRG